MKNGTRHFRSYEYCRNSGIACTPIRLMPPLIANPRLVHNAPYRLAELRAWSLHPLRIRAPIGTEGNKGKSM